MSNRKFQPGVGRRLAVAVGIIGIWAVCAALSTVVTFEKLWGNESDAERAIAAVTGVLYGTVLALPVLGVLWLLWQLWLWVTTGGLRR